MRFILEYNVYSNRESKTRTKELSKEEFLSILKDKCSQFSFNNDQLYRKTNNSFGEYGLFLSEERKGTIGNYNYKTFFDLRKDYPVPRYKSLIGSTTKEGADIFGSDNKVYLVIPFDNSEIIFAGSPDLALWSKVDQEFTDDLFILSKYTKDFKIPKNRLQSILNSSKLSTWSQKVEKYGFEFFTNSSCLLLDIKEIDWLKNKMNVLLNEEKKSFFSHSVYNRLVENKVLENEIKDILLYFIDDENINIEINFLKDTYYTRLTNNSNREIIRITFSGIFTPYDKIESLDHLNSFLEEQGYKYFNNGSFYYTYEEIRESFKDKDRLSLLDIYYIR